MADSTTLNLLLVLPEIGASFNTWGQRLNSNFDALDLLFDEDLGHQHTGANGDAPPLGRLGLGLLNAGFPSSISADVFVARSLAAGAGIGVTNPAGIAGDPSISLTPATLPPLTEPVASDDLVPYADVSNGNTAKKATRTELLTQALHTSPRLKSVSDGAGSGAYAFNAALGNYRIRQITGASTFSVTNVPVSDAFGIIFELINPGSAAITWPASFRWPGGTPPAFTVSGVDIIVALTRDGGATFRAALTQSDSR